MVFYIFKYTQHYTNSPIAACNIISFTQKHDYYPAMPQTEHIISST